MRLIRPLAFVVLLVFGCWMAHELITHLFRSYDDEGFMLLSLTNFVHGRLLYDQIYAQYGPFFYVVQASTYWLLHQPLTHDGGRIVALAYWLGAAAAGGGFIYRYSRDLVLSGVAFGAISICEKGLSAEPGHPQQNIIFLLMLAAFLSTWVFSGKARWPALFFLGAIGAALILMKINVGVFYTMALGTALLTFFSSERLRRWGWTAGIFLYGVLPLLFMRHHWRDGFLLLSVVMAAGMSLLAFASARFPVRQKLTLADLAIATAGFVVAAGGTIGIMLGLGVSANGLWQGIIVVPLRQPDIYLMPFHPLATASLLAAVLLLTAAMWWANAGAIVRPYIPHLQILAGFGLPLLLIRHPNTGVICSALVASLALWNAGEETRIDRGFVAFFMTHMALLQILQSYPIAGSQVLTAATALVAWSLILLADGIAGVRRAMPVERRRLGGLVLQLPLLLAVLASPFEVLAMHEFEDKGIVKVPSDLPGSAMIRMPPEQAALYRWLTLNVPRHCDTLFGMPGSGSMNIWSGVPEPNAPFISAWMNTFSPRLQNQVVAALRSHARPCVVYTPELVQFWLRGRPMAEGPLKDYILDDLQTVTKAGGVEIRVPNAAAANWDEDLILTNPHELAGDAIGLPSELFKHGPAAIHFDVQSGVGGLAMQSTCVAESALPCLAIQADGLSLGTAEQPGLRQSVSLADNQWHKIVLQDSGNTWTVSVDGRQVAQTDVNPSSNNSPAFLLTGSGKLRDFVLSRK